MMDDGHAISGFDLTRESRLLQGLARRVLADEHLAADVAQETWLTLLRNKTIKLESPRHFLKRVARNIAVDFVRSKDRRRHREERHVGPVASPAADELAHKSNVRERMRAALDGLPQKYRDVLWLRYYEDLSPPSIAEQLDVPLETVRTRLKRGLAQLKLQLQREFRDDPGGWPWALGLLLPPGEIAPPPATSAGLEAGGLAGRWLVVAAAAIVPALVVVLAWSARDDERSARAGSLQPLATLAAAPAPESLHLPVGRSPLATLLRVEVVIDEDGTPLPAAEVHLAWGERGTHDVPEVPDVTGTTDAAGFFETTVPVGAHLRIDVARTSGTRGGLRELEVAQTENASALVATVRVSSKRSIAGRVLDLAGAPIAGARVSLYPTRGDLIETRPPAKTVRADARGMYQLHGLGDSFFVRATNETRVSFVTLRGRGVAAKTFEGVDFTLADSGRIEGLALTGDGQPVEAVEISVRSAHAKVSRDPSPQMQFVKPFRRVLSDRLGRFSVAGLPFGRYTVTASRPPLVSSWANLTLDSAKQELELRLGQGADVSVTVRDENGAPLEHARVTLWRGHAGAEPDIPHGHPKPQQDNVTARDGGALFGGQRTGAPTLIVVRAPGHAPQTIGPVMPPLELDVRMKPARRFEGRILSPSGEPLEDAYVIVRPRLDFEHLVEGGLDRYCEQSLSDGRIAAEPDGRFVYTDAPHGPLAVLAVARTADGGTLVLETEAGADAHRIDLVMKPAARFEGRVVDALSGQPLVGARVIAPSVETAQRWDTYTGPDGDYRIELPVAHSWTLVYEKDGYARTCIQTHDEDGGTIDASLHGACVLVLEIVDAEGVPISSARVTLEDDAGHSVLTGPREGRGWENADPLGRVQFVNAPAAPLRAFVHLPELPRPRTFRLDLSEGVDLTRRLVLERFASALPTLPVAIHLQVDPSLGEARWSWGAPDAERPRYEGPVELHATDARGWTTLHAVWIGGAPNPEAAGADTGTTSRFMTEAGPAPLNLRRTAALESWPGSSAWSRLPIGDPFSAVPLPAESGELLLNCGRTEVRIPLGRSGPRSSTLTIVVPARR